MVIKYFYADWCNYCKAFDPIIRKFAQDKGIELEFHELESSEEIQAYEITSFPTLLVFNGDSRIDIVGIKTYDELEQLIFNQN